MARQPGGQGITRHPCRIGALSSNHELETPINERAAAILAEAEATRLDAFGLALTTPRDIEQAKAAILQAEAAGRGMENQTVEEPRT